MFSARLLLKTAKIQEGCKADYKAFERLHYRKGKLPVVDKVFTLQVENYGKAAVIVYAFAPAHLKARREAIGHLLPKNASRSDVIGFINANIRIISRVVVLPEFRGANAAAFLVRSTIPLIEVPIIEAAAVIGKFNSFFDAAGMQTHICRPSPQKRRMRKALAQSGFRGDMWIDVDLSSRFITDLGGEKRQTLEKEITSFLGAYGSKRRLTNTRERIKIVLSKLTGKTAYFYHINKALLYKDTKWQK